MPGMPDIILKAPVFQRIAAKTREKGFSNSQKLATIIAELKNPAKTIADVALGAGMYKDNKQAEHLKRDWLDEDPGNAGFWHTNGFDVPGLIRAAMIHALELYQSTGKPIDMVWIIAPPWPKDDDDAPWKIATVESDNNIMVTFFTPRVPCTVPTIADPAIMITEQDATGAIVTRPAQKPTS